MIKIYPLKTQPERWEKSQIWFTDSSWIFFFLYINRGLVTSTIFCSFALFQEMRTSSTSTLVRASYRWQMQGSGLSASVCEGCKVFFFSKHPSLVSTVFGGRIPTARSSSCALWPWVSERFFLFGLMLFQNSCAQNFLHKLEATPHLNGKHVVFGKVRSAKGAKGVN